MFLSAAKMNINTLTQVKHWFTKIWHVFVFLHILALVGCKITYIAEWNGQFSINDMGKMDRSYISYHCLKPRRHRIGSHYTAALDVKLGNFFVAPGNTATQEYFTGKHLVSVSVWQTCFISVWHVTIAHFHQLIEFLAYHDGWGWVGVGVLYLRWCPP